MSDFLAMGGYAQFVWSAFGVTAFVLVANIFAARKRFRVTLEHLSIRAARQENRGMSYDA